MDPVATKWPSPWKEQRDERGRMTAWGQDDVVLKRVLEFAYGSESIFSVKII